MGFRRYNSNDVNHSRFYQMPKFLWEGRYKTELSSEAKILYALLRDRHELSLSNNWHNEKGEIYLIFKRDEMCDMLGWGKDKVLKIKNELKNFNLMEEERQGVNRPNLIFLNYIDTSSQATPPNTDDETPEREEDNENSEKMASTLEVGNTDLRKSENPTSGSLNFRHQEVGKTDTNDTYINKTDYNENNNQSIYQEEGPIDDFSYRQQKLLLEDEIKEDILLDERIPFTYLRERELITGAVHLICNWNELSQKEYWSDSNDHSAYRTFNSALIELLTNDNNGNILAQLNSFLTIENKSIDIDELRETATDNFLKACESTKIRNPLAYMKTCVTSAMKTGFVFSGY